MYEKCVKMSKERDRPILHRKTGTISVANLHRRKLLFSRLKNFAIFKSCVDPSNPTDSKHVHWASPIKQIHYINVPTVKENTAQRKDKMVKMELKPAIRSMNVAAIPMNLTPYYCFDCQQYYSSRSKLIRHKETQKHQQQVICQPCVDPVSPTKSSHAELASPIKQEFPAVEKDTIEIVTKPMNLKPFYCSICHQQYCSQKYLNRHKNTTKHQDNVHIQLRKLQHNQQAWTYEKCVAIRGKFSFFCK